MPSSSASRWIGGVLLWTLATAGPVIWLRRRWTLTGDIAEDPWYVVAFIVVGVVAALLVDRRAVTDPRRRPTLVVAAILVAALTVSAAWSLDPGFTVTHGIRLAGTLAIGLLLATRFSRLEQVATLWIAVQLGCLWSAFDIGRLTPGSQDRRENWVGIFVNRNLLGLVCGVGITTAVLLGVWVVRRWTGTPRLVAIGVLAMSLALDAYLLRGSGSATPVGVLALLALGVAVVLALRRTGRCGPRVVTGLSLLVVAFVGASAWIVPHLAGLAGRDGDLSRRRPLWDFVLDRVAERPLWGWGYLGPWDDRGFRRELRTYVERAADLRTAHNSTLEVVLGAGVVVLAVFLVFLVMSTRSTLAIALDRDEASDAGSGVLALWPLVAVAWFLAESLTETFLVADTLPTLLLFVGASAIAPGRHRVAADGGPLRESATFGHEPRSAAH